MFVFDNIDQYVDVFEAKTVGAMNYFFEEASKCTSNCKFIFTARPRILYPQATFLQLELHGLSVEEATQLFSKRGLNVNAKQAADVHDLTQGHPLWINLIAMQVLTNRVDLSSLISRIRTGKEAGLPNPMLQEIWGALKPKHQILLRYLAEMVRPETEIDIAQYVQSQLNHNQFNKLMRQLKALDLVVVKSPQNAPDTIELHPLLREFVRRKFSKSERSPYISATILLFDRLIVKLRPSLEEEA